MDDTPDHPDVDGTAEGSLSEQPEWRPLERLLPEAYWGDFMWMHTERYGEVRIEFYKHRITRRYLCLDHDGRAYVAYDDTTWLVIDPDDALEFIFVGLEELGWPRDTHDDEAFYAACVARQERQRHHHPRRRPPRRRPHRRRH